MLDYSTWGDSWGDAWGDAWGCRDAELPRGGDDAPRRVRRDKLEDERLRRLRKALSAVKKADKTEAKADVAKAVKAVEAVRAAPGINPFAAEDIPPLTVDLGRVEQIKAAMAAIQSQIATYEAARRKRQNDDAIIMLLLG